MRDRCETKNSSFNAVNINVQRFQSSSVEGSVHFIRDRGTSGGKVPFFIDGTGHFFEHKMNAYILEVFVDHIVLALDILGRHILVFISQNDMVVRRHFRVKLSEASSSTVDLIVELLDEHVHLLDFWVFKIHVGSAPIASVGFDDTGEFTFMMLQRFRQISFMMVVMVIMDAVSKSEPGQDSGQQQRTEQTHDAWKVNARAGLIVLWKKGGTGHQGRHTVTV